MLGVDCETIMEKDQALSLQSAILSQKELERCPDSIPFASFLTLAFSAKEALYKALSPKQDRILEFSDVTVIRCDRDRVFLSFAERYYEALYHLDDKECLTLVCELPINAKTS